MIAYCNRSYYRAKKLRNKHQIDLLPDLGHGFSVRLSSDALPSRCQIRELLRKKRFVSVAVGRSTEDLRHLVQQIRQRRCFYGGKIFFLN